jgi:hypothetical protein
MMEGILPGAAQIGLAQSVDAGQFAIFILQFPRLDCTSIL